MNETHNTSENPIGIVISSFNEDSTAFFYYFSFNSNKGEKKIESCRVSISCYWRIHYIEIIYMDIDDNDEDEDNDDACIRLFYFHHIIYGTD